MVGVLQKAGVDLHLAGKNRLHLSGYRSPRPESRQDVRSDRQSCGMTPSCLLPGEGLLAQLVPALVELALVLVRPFLGHMMRSVRRAGSEIR